MDSETAASQAEFAAIDELFGFGCAWHAGFPQRIEAVKRPHLLIGGLGMGFTLRAALAVLGSEARIVVAELVPAVIACP